MKKVALFALVCCLFFAAVSAASDVVVLTEENFDEKVFAPDSKGWMIEFYAPWCGHCKRLEPVWEAFATQVKGRLGVGKVDATTHEELAALYEVNSYPTIIFISKEGQWKDYVGQREKDHFVAFSLVGGHEEYPGKKAPRTHEEVVVPAAPKVSDVVVLTSANFSSAISKGSWLIEFYAPWCGHCKNLAPEWERLATDAKLEGLNVAKVDATQESFLGTLYDIRGYPSIKYFPGTGKFYDYSGPRTKKEFLQFTRTGYQLATAHDVPSETAANILKTLHAWWQPLEPYAELAVTEYLGVTFLVLTALGAIVGFLFGRLTAAPTRIYVMSQEQYDKYKKLREGKEGQQGQGKEKEGKGKNKKEEPKKETKKEEPKKEGNKQNNNNKNNKNNNNNNNKGKKETKKSK